MFTSKGWRGAPSDLSFSLLNVFCVWRSHVLSCCCGSTSRLINWYSVRVPKVLVVCCSRGGPFFSHLQRLNSWLISKISSFSHGNVSLGVCSSLWEQLCPCPFGHCTLNVIFIWGHILGVKQSFWGRRDKTEPTGSQERRGRLVLQYVEKLANFPP